MMEPYANLDHPQTRVRNPMADAEDPLDFILYEHLRHRVMCTALEALAEDAAPDAATVAKLAAFIRSDLSQHIADEENVFFPMLRRRCLPEDEIDSALQRMNREHAEDRELSTDVRIILMKVATEGRPVSVFPGAQEALKLFAQHQRRHMMLENAVLIPLARRRLTDEDMRALIARLATRRTLSIASPHK
jgi:hemerythrin-like domain-containing protein